MSGVMNELVSYRQQIYSEDSNKQGENTESG